MGAALRSNPLPHPPLCIELPEGVGRLDDGALAKEVRDDVVALIARSWAGSPQREPDPLIAWVLGRQMQDMKDVRRMIVTSHLARCAWDYTISACGGFALGVLNGHGQLGGMLLALPRLGRPSFTLEVSEKNTMRYLAGKFPQIQPDSAGIGVQCRWKAFERIRKERFKHITVAHVEISQLRMDTDITAAKAADLELKLAKAISSYADVRGLPIYMLAMGWTAANLLQDCCGFQCEGVFGLPGALDPDHSESFDEIIALSRSPQSPTRTEP